MRWRRLVLPSVVAVSVATFPACGGSTGGEKVLKIGVIAPLDAGLARFGRGIRNSVELAADEANEQRTVPGWRIEVVALDDSSDPGLGAAAARKLAADGDVAGVIGTYDSAVAARVAPILDRAGITMISPANTDPALTLGPDPDRPSRPHPNYFRMVLTDTRQGPFLARMAYSSVAQARRVAVVSVAQPAGRGLADAFSAAYSRGGGEVVATKVVPGGATDFAGLVAELGPLTPDLLFFGGGYDLAAALRRQASGAGITAPVMGGDGVKDEAYIAKAGPASEGDLASSFGVPPSTPSAQTFLEAYARAGFAEPPSDLGPYAYDATNVLLAAASRALRGHVQVTGALRRAITARVQDTNTAGITGRIAFDPFGDTTGKALTLYRVEGAAWVPVASS